MRPQTAGTEQRVLEAVKSDQGRTNRLLWSFMAVSLVVHGWVLAVASRHLHRQPVQVIELELTAPAKQEKQKVLPGLPPKGMVKEERVRSSPVPNLSPAVAKTPEPPVPPKPVQTISRSQPTEAPHVVPKPRPKIHRKAVSNSAPDLNVPTREIKQSAPAVSAGLASQVASNKPQEPSTAAVVDNPDALKRFLAEVRLRIDRCKQYPFAARRRHMAGRVTVCFAIHPDGSVRGLEVVESSGFSVLDRAALEAVNRAAPFPEFPREMLNRALEVEIGVVFELT